MVSKRRLSDANHTAKILGEVKDRCQSKLSERSAENLAAVPEDDVAFDQPWEKRLLQTSRPGMDPTQTARHQEHLLKKRKRARPIQNNLGVSASPGKISP